MTASVVAINISRQKGERKASVSVAELRAEHGIVGDAHAGDWHRQVSLLAEESIDKMRKLGLELDPGAFAENITTAGLDLPSLAVGSRFTIGPVLLEITQIGKKCHDRCAIYHQAGDCVMPKEGVFARVLRGGTIRSRDSIEVLSGQKLMIPPEAGEGCSGGAEVLR